MNARLQMAARQLEGTEPNPDGGWYFTDTSGEGRITGIEGAAHTWAEIVAAAEAITDAELAAWQAARAYAEPAVLVPMLDADGAVVGKVRILATQDGALVAVVDTASPQRPWTEQLAAFRARKSATVAQEARTRDIAASAAAANSVPALRAEVARLADLVRAILEGATP
jgi:hypothetical protein